MRILVTYAVQGEFTELKFPGLIGEEEVQIGYLRTGVGKVKSAFYLSEAISHAQPDLVVNVGTAGTIRHRVGDIFVCRHFVDRDMQKLVEQRVQFFKHISSSSFIVCDASPHCSCNVRESPS
jgi:adenosylhomocysteine nucleosidase